MEKAKAANIPLPPTPAAPPRDTEESDISHHAMEDWKTELTLALGHATRGVMAFQAKLKRNNCRSLISQRCGEFLEASMGKAKYGSVLKRIGHKREAKLIHTQVSVKGASGASTDPLIIQAETAKTIFEWHASRRSGPPSGARYAWVVELYAHPPPPLTDAVAPASPEELDKLVRTMKQDGCPGESGISIRHIRLLPDEVKDLLLAIINLCLKWGSVPLLFLMALIFMIPKSGKPSLTNSRPISLLETPLKLTTRLVNGRVISSLCDRSYFSDVQFGFLPGKACIEAFHVLLGCIEDARLGLKPIHVCLVDLEKAFDSLENWSLEMGYKHAGLSAPTIKFMLALDGTGKSKVITPFGCTEPIDIQRGVRQGEVLSPTKFIIWLEAWLQHVAKQYPDVGYKLPDGTRILLICFADDLAVVTSSHAEMQLIMNSLAEFLSFHGVTLNAAKTHYVARGSCRPLKLRKFDRSSRSGFGAAPDSVKHVTVTIKCGSTAKILTYLGGAISLDLDWPELNKALVGKVRAQLGRLRGKAITLAEVASFASMCTQGMAAYYLQLGHLPIGMLETLDRELDRVLRAKAKLPFTASTALLHAPKKSGGLGIFTFKGLAQAACTTELLVRLQSPGIVGKVCRQRWNAMKLLTGADSARDATLLKKVEASCFFPAYCITLASELGYQICDSDDLLEATATFSGASGLSDILPSPIVSKIDAAFGHRVMTDISVEEDKGPDSVSYVLPPPDFFGPKGAGIHELLASEPVFAIPPPILKGPRGLFPLPAPPDLNLLPAQALWPRTRQEPRAPGSFFMDLGDLVPAVPASMADRDWITFCTDGGLDHDRIPGTIVGGGGSITDLQIPGWELASTRIHIEKCQVEGYEPFQISYHKRQITVECLGDEPLAPDTMELLSVVDVLWHAPLQPLFIYVDPTYITLNMERWLNGLPSRRQVRFSNHDVWKDFCRASAFRSSHNAPVIIRRCSAHGRNLDQDPIVSLGNALADHNAGHAATSAPPTTTHFPSMGARSPWCITEKWSGATLDVTFSSQHVAGSPSMPQRLRLRALSLALLRKASSR